ncbi:MAG: hypothetical protein ACLPID_13685 [Beijerinckiaceae bacterium]
MSSTSGFALERLSVFALGVVPIFSVLMIVELIRMAFPNLQRQASSQFGHANLLHPGIYFTALVLAEFQALGIANGLERMPGLVEEPNFGFRAEIAVTLIAATALLAWLSHLVTRDGLGNGFWLLLITPYLASLPNLSLGIFNLWQRGGIDSGALLGAILFVIFAITLLVGVSKVRWLLPPDGAGPGLRDQERIDFGVVWPPVLATYIGGFLISGLAWLFGFGRSDGDGSQFAHSGPIHFFLVAALIILFTYRRSAGRDPTGASQPIWMMALAQIIVCIGAEFVTRKFNLPFAINGCWLIVIATLALSWRASFHSEMSSLSESATSDA